ncbi:MAG: protein-L-isoaspartate(D-aspartate) O-methyltransferase [Rubrivivax sp.]|nr:protein-L-isoaspartate(D-aspartate) O-methyltransferase [Rubrivivax sp.]
MNAPPPGRRPRFPLGLAQMGQPAGPKPAAMARPQRPLQQAVQDAARMSRPATGLGMDSDAVRARMVQRLRVDGIRDEAVLAAFGRVLRHRFVDSALATQAYEDTSLPIGLEQTISKPSVVARMLALLGDTETARARGSLGRVLEVGTGCGYQTALLAELARHVVSIERLKPLHDKARVHLDDGRGHHRIRLVWGDGRVGHGPQAPYDSIIAAAGGEDLPPAWLEQLADGGRLVAPMHEPGSRRQSLLVVDRQGDRYLRQRHETVLFVPLKSGVE